MRSGEHHQPERGVSHQRGIDSLTSSQLNTGQSTSPVRAALYTCARIDSYATSGDLLTLIRISLQLYFGITQRRPT
jgi:hypothetical protein